MATTLARPFAIPQQVRQELLAGVERQREPTRAWKPQVEGDQVLGTVVRRSLENTDRGEEVEVLRVQTEDGEIIPVWCSAQVLQERLREEDPQLDDFVVVTFFGERESRQGRMYKHYGLKAIRRGKSAATAEPVEARAPGDLEINDQDIPF